MIGELKIGRKKRKGKKTEHKNSQVVKDTDSKTLSLLKKGDAE